MVLGGHAHSHNGNDNGHTHDDIRTVEEGHSHNKQGHGYTANGRTLGGSRSRDGTDEAKRADNIEAPSETSALIQNSMSDLPQERSCNGHVRSQSPGRPSSRDRWWHVNDNHKKPKNEHKSHGDMGTKAMLLHVIGDALGNIGVIVSGLIIWLTSWSGRFYADPTVSLFIAIIILNSAVSLTLASAKVLLQATPDRVDVNSIKGEIEDIRGVVKCHHIHIWQPSDTQIITSLHVQLDFSISKPGGDDRYMELAQAARICLHAYGIHSATIQPEFCEDESHDHAFEAYSMLGLNGSHSAHIGSKRDEDGCLLECVDDCQGDRCF